jgi:restriction system protein
VEPSDLPAYKDFLLPVLQAVQALGGTAHAKEISAWMVENMAFDDEAVAIEYPNRPGESVLLDRMAWARSYDKLTDADKHAILGGNARRLFGISGSPS